MKINTNLLGYMQLYTLFCRMNLKEAFEHLIKGGWEAPNRMFTVRFNRGQISDTRIRSILKANEYYCVCEERWKKSKHKYNPKPL